MRKATCVVVLVLMVWLLAFAGPAEATTLRLRLWSSPKATSLPGEINGEGTRSQGVIDSIAPGNVVWDSTILGLSVRSRPFSRFVWSLSYDTGGVSNLVDTEGGFGTSPGTNSFFAGNLHYVLTPAAMPAGSQVTVFLGYGRHMLDVTNFEGNRNLTASGLQYGLDVFVPLQSDWYVLGSVAWGSWTATHTWPPVTTATGTAQIRDYSVAVGRNLTPMASVEVGYRSISWSTSAIASTPCPCTLGWDGWFAAVAVRVP